jgi:leader peptidase (prepilin peptidase)/N-methyltransferase
MNPYDVLFYSFAFCLGACIGSFLNVCIYRMPRDLSVNEPKRSFCPSCKYQIPWHHNLPLISWLVLRGKCANCGARIAFRYFGVELLTALLFVGVWHWSYERAWILALPLWIMVSLFVVATFIDFEHYIIPDEITWGGAAAGVLLSFAIPKLHGANLTPIQSGIQAVIGAVAGYLLLRGVVEAGKLAFGKKLFSPKKPAKFTWVRRPVETEDGVESDADLIVGDISWKSKPKPSVIESIRMVFLRFLTWLRIYNQPEEERGESWVWSDTFSRESDVLTMKCRTAAIDGEELGECTLIFTYNKVTVGERNWELEKVDKIEGIVISLIVPREAMGLGDVKYMACIGAFLGWKGVLFTLVAASMIGAVIGVITIAIGKREWSAKIPFGPYLSAGAMTWLFSGPQIVAWYWGLTHP